MFLLIVLLLFSLALFLRKLAKREGFLQYPALASLVYLIWVIPQLISMHYSAVQFNASELFILELFCLICLGAIFLGWHTGISYGKRSTFSVVSSKKLIQLTIFLTLVTFTMSILLLRVDTSDGSSSVNWSGPITIIYFFTIST